MSSLAWIKSERAFFCQLALSRSDCAKGLGIADLATLASDPQSDRHLVIGLSLQ
jgi:hypothetical protein